MKRWIVAIGILIIIIGAGWITYVKYPRTVDVQLSGVKYQLGSEGAKFGTEPTAVVIQGKLYTSLRGDRVFKGTIDIAGEQIPVPADQRKLEIHFADDGWGSMAYPYVILNGRGAAVDTEIYQSHQLFANADFSQVTFLLSTPDNYSTGAKGHTVWSDVNGMMLSAPASSREEALALSNMLMRDFIKKPLQ
ncbi:hypothetical protein [Paenibacillus sp. OV219]|uniref:hypothetical protein n=1 Tax=Paenibacillus sp. OV219 TaxID=1884377 RepID=UPI0008CE8588|nr:hypothetical protein [Paenibacillus sp. OV219]SEO53063.1 hypothetical protein SAMN05518847_108179 [Paenibacillus sp. OV219]